MLMNEIKIITSGIGGMKYISILFLEDYNPTKMKLKNGCIKEETSIKCKEMTLLNVEILFVFFCFRNL